MASADDAADVNMSDPAPEAKSDADAGMTDKDSTPAADMDAPVAPEEPEGPSAEERVTTAEQSKEVGNELLKSANFEGAVAKYGEGVGLLQPLLEKTDLEGDLPQRRTAVYTALCLNSAQACIKQSKWLDAAEHAGNVLALDKDNAKALYRRGVASMELDTESRLDQAKTDLARFVQLEPGNREARERLLKVKERLKEAKQKEKERYAKVCNGAMYKDSHAKLDRAKLEYEEEVKRREGAGEDAITWEDWQKKLKEKLEEDKKKQKENYEARAKEVREEEEQRHCSEENERREKQGLEALSLEEWRKEQANSSPKKEEVVNTGDLELDEEERKMLEEQKNKGYYHGRLGTVLSNDAPKPQMVREASPEVEGNGGNKGSEWNQAGTWEEKDTSAWVKERLSTWLSGSSTTGRSVVLASGGEVELSATIQKVKSISGDAAIVNVRKKKSCGYNYEAELSFRISVKKLGADEEMPPASENGDSPAKDDKKGQRFDGTLSIHELADFVKPEDLKFEASWKGNAPPEHLKKTAMEVLQDLKAAVREQVQGFLHEYNAH